MSATKTLDKPTLKETTTHSGTTKDTQSLGSKWANLGSTVHYFVVYGVFACLSLLLRLIRIDISDDGTPVFDEKHYAVQARQMMFNPGGLEDNTGYGLVVHPPLGKKLIALGEHIAGYTPLGWRLSSVVAGVIIVLALMRIIQIFTSSMAAVITTGITANVEGTQLVMSRMSMLDVFLALFITIATWCIIEDYHRHGTSPAVPWHKRWWLLGSGVSFGLGMGVKISGVFYPALAGVLLVLIVGATSRNVRETFKALGIGLVFYLVVPVCITVLTWLPWFNQENSVYRNIAQAGRIEHELPSWIANMLPDSMNSFASYQIGALKFHTELKSGAGFDNVHPWESKPDQWLLSAARPMMFLDNPSDSPIFGSGESAEKLYLVGNIAVWYLIIPVIAFGLYKLVFTRSFPWLVILSGIGLGTIPWFINYDRQQYFFYVVQFSMFLILGVVLMLYQLSGMISRKTNLTHNQVATVVLGSYVVISCVVFILYIPWMYGLAVPNWYHDQLTLWDSWEMLEKY